MNKVEKIVEFYVLKFLRNSKVLDSIIEEKVKVRMEEDKRLLEILLESNENNTKIKKEKSPEAKRRKLTPKDLGISEDVWQSVYSDILDSNTNPILTEQINTSEKPTDDKPELVPEHVLSQFDFFKDYSKHLEGLEKSDKEPEDLKAREAYLSALGKVQRNV